MTERPQMDDLDLPDSAADVECPYCGERVTVLLDPGSGASQEYVEDCEVCCRPWLLRVQYHTSGRATVRIDVS